MFVVPPMSEAPEIVPAVMIGLTKVLFVSVSVAARVAMMTVALLVRRNDRFVAMIVVLSKKLRRFLDHGLKARGFGLRRITYIVISIPCTSSFH